jgi:hypothetical protein
MIKNEKYDNSMYSATGRATMNLYPQFHSLGDHMLQRGLQGPSAPVKEYSALTRLKKHTQVKSKVDEFYFHNILEYKKESQLKSRETSYIPKVLRTSQAVAGPARRQVRPQV